MNKNFAIAFGVGLACIVAAVSGVFFIQRGAHMELPGKVLKVRTAALDDNSSVAVLDFRVTNPSDVLFVVRNVTLEMEDPQGNSYLGQVAADTDAKRMFEALPLLGQKFNDTLLIRDKIAAHTSQDRMVAARFEAPVARLDARKKFLIRIEEVDGKSFELLER
ncbi:MAG TPA: hypothetical protein VNY05_04995 [Candidatus Acidoferrales bacterium]|jgi:hypothetical protein|nr:hypothetical protein [Candidatus Acidoferrales bacterium]